MDELIEQLEGESSEPNNVPVGIPMSKSLSERYKEVGRLTTAAYGKNRVPKIARKRIAQMLDEIEIEAKKKLGQ